MDEYVLHEERMAQIDAALLQGGLEGRTRGKDTTGVLDGLPYLEAALDENFHKQLEASNLLWSSWRIELS